MGSVIGATQDVDLLCLRRHGIVRIQVDVHSKDIFTKQDGSNEASVSSDVYVKLNGYEFRYVLEEDDYVPDADFVPRIWERHDEHDDCANRDEDMPDRDAIKRAKNTQNDSGNTSSGARYGTNVVSMQTSTVSTMRHPDAVLPSMTHAEHTDGQDIQRSVEPEGEAATVVCAASSLMDACAPKKHALAMASSVHGQLAVGTVHEPVAHMHVAGGAPAQHETHAATPVPMLGS